jgi:hypothetical protein
VLPQIESLPGPESQTPIGDRHDLARMRDGAARMCWHVVSPFVIVTPWSRLWRQIAQPVLKIALYGWIGVLLNDQARGCVLDEDRTKAGRDPARSYHVVDFARHLDESLATRVDFDSGLEKWHDWARDIVPGILCNSLDASVRVNLATLRDPREPVPRRMVRRQGGSS